MGRVVLSLPTLESLPERVQVTVRNPDRQVIHRTEVLADMLGLGLRLIADPLTIELLREGRPVGEVDVALEGAIEGAPQVRTLFVGRTNAAGSLQGPRPDGRFVGANVLVRAEGLLRVEVDLGSGTFPSRLRVDLARQTSAGPVGPHREKPEFVTLPQDYFNSRSASHRLTWMWRGIEEHVRLRDRTSIRPGGDVSFHSHLLPVEHLSMKDRIREACFSAYSSCVYYTVQDNPTTVHARYLPVGENVDKDRAGRRTNVQGTGSILAVSMEWEIVGLQAVGHQLLVLARNRLQANPGYGLARVPLHKDTCFELRFNPLDTRLAKLPLPASWGSGSQNFSFAAVYSPARTLLYVSLAEDASPPIAIALYGDTAVAHELPPDMAQDELRRKGGLDLVAVPGGRSRGARPDMLYAYDGRAGQIVGYSVDAGAKYTPVTHRVVPELAWEDMIQPCSSFDLFSFGSEDLNFGVEIPGGRHEFFVFARPSEHQIWTVGSTSADPALPLVGGDINLPQHGPMPNLCKYRIGTPDSIRCVPGFGIFFGAKGEDGWHCLMLPRGAAYVTGGQGIYRNSPAVLRNTADRLRDGEQKS